MQKKPVEILKTTLLLALAAAVGTGLIVKTEVVSAAVQNALLICSVSVIPSLFPFMVFSSFIAKTSLTDKLGKVLSPITKFCFGLSENCGTVILMSLIGGFPVGPKMAADLYNRGKITKKEAELLCLFCINAGPAFVIGTVGYSMLGSIKSGVVLYISMVISSLITGLVICNSNSESKCKNTVFCEKNPENNTDFKNSVPSNNSADNYVLETFCSSANDSAVAMFQICAYVILFSALTALLSTLPAIVTATRPFLLFKASLEVTAGCALLCADLPGALLLPTVAAMLSFCGFCVHAQVHGSISAGGLTYTKFLIARLSCAAISFLFCRAACLIFPDVSGVFLSTSIPSSTDVSLSAVACISMLFMSILLVLDLDIPKDLC